MIARILDKGKDMDKRYLILCLFVAILSGIGIIFWPKDWAGWLVLGISFFLVFFFDEVYENKTLLFVFVFILFCHHLVSIFNAYVTLIPGATKDAVSFHQKALSFTYDRFLQTGFMGASSYIILLHFFINYAHQDSLVRKWAC